MHNQIDADTDSSLQPKTAKLRTLASISILAIALAYGGQGCGGSSDSGSGASGLPNGKATMAQIAIGRHIVLTTGCKDCHSPNAADPSRAGWMAGYAGAAQTAGAGASQLGPTTWVYAANLTPDAIHGLGGVTDLQVFNALKYGLDPMDTPSVTITSTTPGQGNFPATPHYLPPIMPWASTRNHTDSDLWAIVAYIKHGLTSNANAVLTSDVPPDNWVGASSPGATGAYPIPSFPVSGGETFAP